MKPQFEAGREAASKGRGVIRDAGVREAAIASARGAVQAAGFRVVASADSALAGPKGNVEHFLFARRTIARRARRMTTRGSRVIRPR